MSAENSPFHPHNIRKIEIQAIEHSIARRQQEDYSEPDDPYTVAEFLRVKQALVSEELPLRFSVISSDTVHE